MEEGRSGGGEEWRRGGVEEGRSGGVVSPCVNKSSNRTSEKV